MIIKKKICFGMRDKHTTTTTSSSNFLVFIVFLSVNFLKDHTKYSSEVPRLRGVENHARPEAR
jgi:hypothetical protein